VLVTGFLRQVLDLHLDLIDQVDQQLDSGELDRASGGTLARCLEAPADLGA